MKRVEADSFLKEIKLLSVEKPNKFLLYSIQKTISNLEEIADKIATEYKNLHTQEFFNLEKGRREIVVEFTEKNAEGNPVIEGDYFKIDKSRESEYVEKINAYQETNKELIEKYNKIVDNFDKFLSEEIGEDFLVKISIKNFPEYIEPEKFKILSKLIKESSKEIVGLAD